MEKRRISTPFAGELSTDDSTRPMNAPRGPALSTAWAASDGAARDAEAMPIAATADRIPPEMITPLYAVVFSAAQDRSGLIDPQRSRQAELRLTFLHLAALRPGESPIEPVAESVHVHVHDGRHVQRDQLRKCQTADDGNAQWSPRLRARPRGNRDGQRAHERRHRRHHDRPEP